MFLFIQNSSTCLELRSNVWISLSRSFASMNSTSSGTSPRVRFLNPVTSTPVRLLPLDDDERLGRLVEAAVQRTEIHDRNERSVVRGESLDRLEGSGYDVNVRHPLDTDQVGDVDRVLVGVVGRETEEVHDRSPEKDNGPIVSQTGPFW